MDALRSESEQWLDQIAKRIDKMACAGGVGVLLGSLEPTAMPTVDEAMMTELIARCTERR